MSTKEEDTIQKSKRIAKNTIVLYFRMIFMMFVMLYTSRVILDSLGVEDYGIYNVVGGFVSMFALISAALSSACSRFINYEMGKGNKESLNIVFSTAVNIQVFLALIVLILAEVIGVWYVNNIMVLPKERLVAANWCFQFSVITFCMNLITVPFNASIIAHEKMTAFAYISIYQGLATLLVTFLVLYNPFDKLIYYAFLLLIVQLSVQVAYQIYCRLNFEECHYKKVLNKTLLKKMLSYSGWHLVGNGATVLKNEGVNVVLNLFFGPVVNSARGLAMQVNSALYQFASNFMMAMNPQITQSYAKRDFSYMFNLMKKGSRFSFYLLLVLSLPVLLNTHYILGFWLKEIPDNTVLFVQLAIIATIIASLSAPLVTAQNATGNVRNYQLVVGGVLLLNLPLSYVCLRLGFAAESVFVVAIIVEINCLIARIIMVPQTIKEFNPFDYIKYVIGNCLVVCLVSLPIPLMFRVLNHSENFLSFTISSVISVLSVMLTIYLIGCNKEERLMIKSKICKLHNKVTK